MAFPANNLNVATPTIDLSPYANQSSLNYPGFDLVAMNNLAIQNSLTFTGLLPADKLFLYAGNQLSIASGAAVEADVADFELGSYAAMTLNNASVLNNSGNIALHSVSDVNVQNGATVATGATGTINLNSASGSVTVNNNATIMAFNVNVSAGGNITLDNANVISGNSIVPPAGSQINLAATGMATVNNTDLSTFVKDVISADTVILQNVIFGTGSVVDLQSSSGLLAPNPNTRAAVVPGDVNFVTGVFYGTTPAQLALTSSSGAPGIYIHAPVH